MGRRLPLAVLAALLCGAAGAQAQPLTGSDLVRELTDNTLTGFNGSLWFSEYHAPDGRVLGHNATMQNRDSCWKVRGDAVCYYYPRLQKEEGPSLRGEFCWRFERAGAEGYRLFSLGSPGQGFARLDRGNARNHGDGGRPWTCDELISRRGPEGFTAAGLAALRRR